MKDWYIYFNIHINRNLPVMSSTRKTLVYRSQHGTSIARKIRVYPDGSWCELSTQSASCTIYLIVSNRSVKLDFNLTIMVGTPPHYGASHRHASVVVLFPSTSNWLSVRRLFNLYRVTTIRQELIMKNKKLVQWDTLSNRKDTWRK